MKHKPQPLAKLLTLKASKSNSLITEAKRLSQIGIIINQALDFQLAEHTYVSAATDSLLTLVADSPVWATRLRYMHDAMIKTLKNYSLTKNITHIKVKVRPLALRSKPKTTRRSPPTLSKTAAKRFQEEIKAISDPALRNSLKKILAHAK
ncbi:MAG TPA: DUF721 domain-containing protein [Gammaproteobacteria bacterium]|nr:DUF721 domain-containing protein [Gammaproteobacteria bacterium]